MSACTSIKNQKHDLPVVMLKTDAFYISVRTLCIKKKKGQRKKFFTTATKGTSKLLRWFLNCFTMSTPKNFS